MKQEQNKFQIAVFSWNDEQIQKPNETFRLLEKYKVNAIYQYLSPHHSKEVITSFIETAAKYHPSIYFLTGEPEWALDPKATKLIEFIQQVADYQTNQSFREAVKGIVIDVEPYLLAEYKSNPQMVMKTYVAGLQTAYKVAQFYQLEVIICVPYYFDTLGFTEELASIIQNGSDKLAVMNYYRGKEIEHLKTEVKLSQPHHSAIVTIYELQPPGRHQLTDQHTYYNQGIQATYTNFYQLQQEFPQTKVELAFHEFTYFKQLSQRQ